MTENRLGSDGNHHNFEQGYKEQMLVAFFFVKENHVQKIDFVDNEPRQILPKCEYLKIDVILVLNKLKLD